MSEVTQQVRNRRIHLRRPSRRTTKVVCRKGELDMGQNIALKVLDISETGTCLVVKERLETNDEVTVSLEGTSHRRPLRFGARVAWCVETADQQFCVGVQFHKRMPYAELTKLT